MYRLHLNFELCGYRVGERRGEERRGVGILQQTALEDLLLYRFHLRCPKYKQKRERERPKKTHNQMLQNPRAVEKADHGLCD